jgi:hypothetical protein
MNRYLHCCLLALTVSLLLAEAGRAGEQAPPDPAGVWVLHMDLPGRPQGDSKLVLERAADRYVGVLSDSRGRTTPLNEVQYKDGELSFEVKLERRRQEARMLYKGKVAADAFIGQATFNARGRTVTAEFKGSRLKAEVIAVGSWKIEMTLASGQKVHPTLAVKNKDGKLTGEYLGSSGQKTTVQDLQLKAGELSFSAPDSIDQDRMVFHFVGKLTGETLKGVAQARPGRWSRQPALYGLEIAKAGRRRGRHLEAQGCPEGRTDLRADDPPGSDGHGPERHLRR